MPTVTELQARAKVRRLQERATVERPTVKDRAREIFGFDDLAQRGTIVPLGRTKEGDLTLATPQILKDVAESALLPGHVAQGGEFTPEDVTKFALDVAVPATAGRGVGAALRPSAPGKRALTEAAPSTEQLKGQARAFKTAATSSGVVVDPNKFGDLVAGVETTVRLNKLNPVLHPKSSAVFDILSKQVGDDLDVEDLMIARRLIGTAQRTVDPDLADDRRIANMIEDALDDFVENLSPDDVLGGDPAKLGVNLKEFRLLWSRAKKSEAVDAIIEQATQQASGFENGIRIGFRALLKNKRKIRGFSPGEVKAMKEIVAGTTGQKTLRLLGKLSFGTKGGSNFIGGTAGVVAGGALGGPLGSAAAPVIGLAAQKGADRAALSSANTIRAMAATGQAPSGLITKNLLADLAERSLPPLAGTELPQNRLAPNRR